MPETIKRLSLDRRVDLIMAFYRDAANTKFRSRSEIETTIATLRREIKRQMENAIKHDRELRDGLEIEYTDDELCPSCGALAKAHGTVHTGKWIAFVCAGISGSKIFISPDAAAAVVDAFEEKKHGERQPGDAAADSGLPVSGE